MIVADTSPLIFLARINLLDALPRMFHQVLLPPQVLQEATIDARRPGAQGVTKAVEAGWLEVVAPTRKADLTRLARMVDLGEAAAIALANELGVQGLLIDDAAGRRLAAAEGLVPVGTLGVLIRAQREGLVTDAPARLSALEAAGLRMDAGLRARVLAVLRTPR